MTSRHLPRHTSSAPAFSEAVRRAYRAGSCWKLAVALSREVEGGLPLLLVSGPNVTNWAHCGVLLDAYFVDCDGRHSFAWVLKQYAPAESFRVFPVGEAFLLTLAGAPEGWTPDETTVALARELLGNFPKRW